MGLLTHHSPRRRCGDCQNQRAGLSVSLTEDSLISGRGKTSQWRERMANCVPQCVPNHPLQLGGHSQIQPRFSALGSLIPLDRGLQTTASGPIHPTTRLSAPSPGSAVYPQNGPTELSQVSRDLLPPPQQSPAQVPSTVLSLVGRTAIILAANHALAPALTGHTYLRLHLLCLLLPTTATATQSTPRSSPPPKSMLQARTLGEALLGTLMLQGTLMGALM